MKVGVISKIIIFRYKTWNVLQLLDVDYAAGRIVDGILKEREDIMVPRSIFFAKYFYGLVHL